MRIEEAEAVPGSDSAPKVERSSELTTAEQQRVKAMQRLANAGDRTTYLALQQEIAQQLNMSVRNVQYLLKA